MSYRYIRYDNNEFNTGSAIDTEVIPLDLYDLTGLGHSSSAIDTWLNGIVALGAPYPDELILVGNDNPTSDVVTGSSEARQTLFDNYVLVQYNTGYTP